MYRARAIYNALKHGLLPWWMYERQRHYDCTYWEHLVINLKYACRWMMFTEDASDVEFEKNNHVQPAHR